MKLILKFAGAASAVLLAGTVTASAALIDFTVGLPGVLSDPAGPGGGWTVTGNPVLPNSSEAGPGAVGPLAGDNDGLGIRNDEISGDIQYVTVTFGKKVKLTGFHVLDLYVSLTNAENYETALVSKGAVPGAPADASLAATEVIGGGFGLPGYGSAATSLKGTSFTFFVGPADPGVGAGGTGNDDVGQRDFALAALEISAVPLPSGALLLLTAMGGIAASRRKRS